MDDVFKNIEEYNPNKERKVLILFDGMIADMLSNKKPNQLVTQLFIRERKSNVSLVFFAQSYFAPLKYIRLNSTHAFVMKLPKKWELQQIELNVSSDITLKTLWVFKKSFRQNLSSFRKNLF